MKSPFLSKIIEKFHNKNETIDSESTKENMSGEASKPTFALNRPKVGDAQLPPLPSPPPKEHKDFIHSTPPVPPTYRKFTVFTAGSIELGKAIDWQPLMATLLSPLPITVCNPRRPNFEWDPTISQQAKDEKLREQIEWELDALEQADVILFFFDVDTNSPVTLLELGLWAPSGKAVVCCGQQYHRSGNVDIVCERYGVPRVETLKDLVPKVKEMLVQKGMKLDDNGDLIGENVHVTKEKPKSKLKLEEEKAELQRQVDALKAMLAAQSKM